MAIEPKKFVVIPMDAFNLLMRRHSELPEAVKAATEGCAADGQTHYVVEMKAIATRADRPVKVTKLS